MYGAEDHNRLVNLIRLSIGEADTTSVNFSTEAQRAARQRSEVERIPRANISFHDQPFRDKYPGKFRSWHQEPVRTVNIYFPERFYNMKPEELAVMLVSAFFAWKTEADAPEKAIRYGEYLLSVYRNGSSNLKTQYPKAAAIKEAYSLA